MSDLKDFYLIPCEPFSEEGCCFLNPKFLEEFPALVFDENGEDLCDGVFTNGLSRVKFSFNATKYPFFIVARYSPDDRTWRTHIFRYFSKGKLDEEIIETDQNIFLKKLVLVPVAIEARFLEKEEAWEIVNKTEQNLKVNLHDSLKLNSKAQPKFDISAGKSVLLNLQETILLSWKDDLGTHFLYPSFP